MRLLVTGTLHAKVIIINIVILNGSAELMFSPGADNYPGKECLTYHYQISVIFILVKIRKESGYYSW